MHNLRRGARRYEIPVHFDEVLEYWEGVRDRAGIIDARELLAEKLGYAGPVGFDAWLDVTHLRDLVAGEPAQMAETTERQELWSAEQTLFSRPLNLKELSERRIDAITKLKQVYEKN